MKTQKREATSLLAPPIEAFALPIQSKQATLTPRRMHILAASLAGKRGYYIPMSIIVAWFPD